MPPCFTKPCGLVPVVEGRRERVIRVVKEAFANVGAEIMGRNKFGPQRGPWEDFEWQGWWGDVPPFHTPVFVLTHHLRPSFTLDDTTFSYVCALDDGDDPFEDPACWIKANPLLGVTITEDYLALQVKQAKDIPAKANGIKRLHFCIWTDAESAWMPRETWASIEDASLSLEDFEGKRAWAGLDLSAKADLTAKALVFEDGKRVPGVTTILGRFKESGGLIQWAYNCGRDGIDMNAARDNAANAGALAHALIDADIHGADADALELARAGAEVAAVVELARRPGLWAAAAAS